MGRFSDGQALQKGTCTTPSVECSKQNSAYRSAYDARIKEQGLERVTPETDAALIVAGVARTPEVLFRTGHYASRLLGEGLAVGRAEAVVGAEVNSMRSSMAVNADVWGRVRVDSVLLEFRARLLPSGTVNVGTIFPVK